MMLMLLIFGIAILIGIGYESAGLPGALIAAVVICLIVYPSALFIIGALVWKASQYLVWPLVALGIVKMILDLGSGSTWKKRMQIRFLRRVKILPGVTLNLGMRSAGVSVGPHGAHLGWNSRRGAYASAGLPNTGLYAFHHFKTGDLYEVRGVAGPVLIVLLLVVAIATALSLFGR